MDRKDKLKISVAPDRPTCEQCRQDIDPASVQGTEAADYIHHFCGTQCLDEWRKRRADEKKSD